MPTLQDLLGVPQEQSITTTGPTPSTTPSGMGIPDIPTAETQQVSASDWWNQFKEAPASPTTKLEPTQFDWERSGADRFVNNRHIREQGFDPYMGSVTQDGKTYDLNEIRYQHVNTFGDVMKAGIGQFTGLAWNSFKGGAVADGRLFNALFNWGSDKSFQERLIGTPEDMLAEDKEQKRIMNKYAIFESPDTQGVMNKEFLGSMLGQLGFTVGTGAYVLGETVLTAGLVNALTPLAKAQQLTRLGKALEGAGTAAERAHYLQYIDAVKKGTTTGEMINDIRRMTDVAKDRGFMQSFYNGLKNMVPGYQAVNDSRLALQAGGTTGQVIAAGFPGFVKSWTMFNAARSEATVEAAGTYGQLYMGLQDQYEKSHGYPPTGSDLERIREAAYGAATDNYISNTGLLSVMNELEFGNIMSKFSSTKRAFRKAAEGIGKDMYTVTAKDAVGEVVSKAYRNGALGSWGNVLQMRKDFGLGTALWQVGKRSLTGQAAKFELSEGIQEILQNSSDQTLREYYTNLYNGNKDLNGSWLKDITSADWSNGLASQLNKEGWKTFLMGATTGLFLSPISGMAMGVRNKVQSSVSKEYRDQETAHNQLVQDNINTLNTFWGNRKSNLLQYLSGVKTQMQSAKNMKDALPDDDRYTFYNSQDDALAKAANVASRTGNMDSFLESLLSLADGRLTDEEFTDAVGSSTPLKAQEEMQQVVNQIRQYYTNYQNLKDRYGDIIIPEIHSDPREYQLATEQKAAMDEAISTLATTSYHATRAIERANQIKTEMGKLEDIGSSVSHTFDIMGSTTNTDKEILLLKEQIQNLSALQGGKDSVGKDIAAELRVLNVQLERLQSWKDNYIAFKALQSTPVVQDSDEHKEGLRLLQELKKSFYEYTTLQNVLSQVGPSVIRTEQLEKAFNGIGDYMALNRDYGQYIDALNVLSDPKNLRTAYYRILKAQKEAYEAVQKEAEKEIVDRADATIGKPQPKATQIDDEGNPIEENPYIEEEGVHYPEQVHEEPEERDNKIQSMLEDDRRVILAHYASGDKRPITAMDSHEVLENQLAKVDTYYPAEERKQAKEDIINDYFDKMVNKVTEKLDIPGLSTNPHIIESNGKYAVSANGKEVSKYVGSIRQANRDLQKYVDQHHPIVPGTDYRVGQKVYDEHGAYIIKEKGGKYYLRPEKEGTKNKDVEVTAEYIAENYYSSEQEVVKGEPETLTPFDSTQPKSSDPYAVVNIAPVDNDEQNLRKNMLSIPQEHLTTGQGFSIVVQENPQVNKGVYPIQGNSQIHQKGQRYSIQLQHDGQPIGYITNPAPQVYKAPDGIQKLIKDLTLADIEALYQMTPQMPTAQVWKDKLVADDNNGARLQQLIQEAIDQGGTLDIEGKLQIDPHYNYSWIKQGETGARLGDIQGLQAGRKGLKMYVVNNYREGEEALVQDTMTKKESDKAKKVQPAGQLSYYTAIVMLDNGRMIPLQLTPRRLSVIEGEQLIDSLGNIETTEQLEKANDTLRKLFISLPVYNDEHWDKKGMMVSVMSVGTGKDNHLFIKVRQKIGKETVNIGTGNIYGQVTSTKDLVDKLNKVLQSGSIKADMPVLDESNLRWQPDNANLQDMETSVNPEVFRSISITYNVPDTRGQKRVRDVVPTIEKIEETPEILAAREKAVDIQQPIIDALRKRTSKVAEKRKKTQELRKGVPKVIQYNTFSDSDIEDIERFREFVSDNLPEWMTVGELEDVVQNMQNEHITVGQFIMYTDALGNKRGRIETRAGNPYKYHEAFHGVYRMLLNKGQQQQLRDEAPDPTTSQLNELRDSHPRYTDMSTEELRDEWKEEWMADKFDEYSMGKKVGGLKGLFDKILRWIQYIADSITGNRLRALAYKIHSGSYQRAALQSNPFTDNLNTAVSVPKAIRIGTDETEVKTASGTKKVIVDRYLPSYTTSRLIGDITAQVILEMQAQRYPSYQSAIEDIMNRYRDSYNPDSERNQDILDSIDNPRAADDWEDRLADLYIALDDDEPREAIKSAIQENLRIQGVKQSIIDEEDNDIDEYTGNPWKAKSSVGGYSAVDRDLRTYIASTITTYTPVIEYITIFGDDSPMIQAVDTNIVYNGMLKLLSQSSDRNTQMDNIIQYKNQGNNPDTVAFINKWLSEIGYNEEDGSVQNENLYNKVIKGFSQIDTDYTSVLMDPRDNRVAVIDAGNAGPERNQYREWSNAFYQNYYKQVEDYITNRQTKDADRLYKEATEPINTWWKQTGTIAAKGREITNNDLSELSLDLSNKISANLGIYIHPNYIAYSIIAGKDEDSRTENQQSTLLIYPTAKPVDIQVVKDILLPVLKGHENPFTRPGAEATPVESLLLRIAKYNSIFDSTVDSMSHTNSRGDSVYNYQYGSYNTVTIQRLNDPAYITNLNSDPDTMSSWLLASEKFGSMTKLMFTAGGLSMKKMGTKAEENEDIEYIYQEDRDKEGTDFSKFNDREYAVYNLSLYDISKNPQAYHKDSTGVWYTVPISLGPIAEKNTHHAVYVPVINAVNNNTPGQEVLDILYKEVQAEAQRIIRVKAEMAVGKRETIERGGKWIDGYHDGAERGTKLFTTRDIVGPDITAAIEADPETLDKEKIEQAISANLMSQVQAYKAMLVEQGVITKEGKNILAPRYLFKGIDKERNDKMYLKAGNLDHNLAQVYINNYIGYIGITRLLYGDKAKSAKDPGDWWKRMAGNNGSGPDTATDGTLQAIIYPADKFPTIHGDTGEADDGQAYYTPNGYRNMLLGSGKLTEQKRKLLDKVERGKDLTVQEWKDMIESGEVLNSVKPVYKDQYTYLKCSIALLNKQDTTDNQGNPLPGREVLYDKLNNALEQEQDNNSVVIGNKSISKAMTANSVPANSTQDELYQYYTTLHEDMMRMQTATPMTPMKGNKSTQPDKQILASQDPGKKVYLNGKIGTAQEAIDQYMESNHQRVLNNATAVVSDLFSPVQDIDQASIKDLVFNTGKFMDNNIDTMKASGKDSQSLELFTTVDGHAQYNINLPPIVETAENIFLANMVKGVTKEKVPMWKMVLRSDTGMSILRQVHALTEDGQPRTWTIIPMDEYKKNKSQYTNLKRLGQDDKFEGLQEGDVVVDRLRDNIPQYDDKGVILYYYTEGLRPYMTIDEKANNHISPALSHSMGARTPGTGFQSYRRVHWVDRLSDVLGNTAILSRDVMVSTGHDYDVDSLFTAVYDTYIDKGERKLYGTATSVPDQYTEYKKWMLVNNKSVRDLYYGDKLYSADEAVGTLLGDEEVDNYRIEQVFKELKLPSTVEQFSKRGGDKLNNGVLTNKALNAQLALLSGEHVSGGGKDALINRPTSTASLEEHIKELAAELIEGEHSEWAKEVSDRLLGKLPDMNGMLGQTEAYDAMQQGGEGIGAVANMLQATAVLNQFGKMVRKYPYTFDSKVYDEYRGTKNSPQYIRDRDADILAQLHVDATKNQLPSKLAITAEYAGILTHMVKLGQTLENAILYPQTYPWQEYARRVAYSNRTFKKGSNKRAHEVMASILKGYKELDAKIIPLDRQMIIDYIKGYHEKGDWKDIEYSLLNTLSDMILLSDSLRYLSRFMRMDTGRYVGTWAEVEHIWNGLEQLGIYRDRVMTDEEFDKAGIPIDVRSVITKDHGNMSANYKVLQAIDTLGPKVFIQKLPAFQQIRESVLENMDEEVLQYDKQWYKNLDQDILSYLSISAYIKDLQDNNRTEVLESLNNDLIWSNPDDPRSIISIIQNLREQLKGKNRNYAVSSFLNTIVKGTKDNTAINQVVANTWTKLSEQQQEKVVGGIVDLIANRKGDIHKGGQALFNYLLVKDGGQFTSGSFIRYIPPFMLKGWSQAMDKVVDIMSKPGAGAEAVFGMDRDTLVDKFVQAYVTHKDNNKYLKEKSPVQDGDTKQWKGAKAVFGPYTAPAIIRKEKPQEFVPYAETEVTKALYDKYGILTGYIGTQGVMIEEKTGKRVGEGMSPRQLLEKMGGTIISAQPVVSSQQMSAEDWRQPLTTTGDIQSTYMRLEQLEQGKEILMESSPEIKVAQMMPRILPESARTETGTRTGVKSDINPNMLSKNGVTVQQAAHNIWEDIGEQYGIDEQDIRNMIIEILQTGKKAYIDNVVRQKEIDSLRATVQEMNTKYLMPDVWKQQLENIYKEKVQDSTAGELFASQKQPVNHAMSYKMPAKDNLTGRNTSTVELAEQGIRTATTRSYPLGKIGDVITFENRPQQYRITGTEQLTQDKVSDPQWIQQWSQKEQWTPEHFNKVLGGSTVHVGSWQTSFEKMKSLRDWMTEAIAYRDSMRGTGVSDADIVNKIKECL